MMFFFFPRDVEFERQYAAGVSDLETAKRHWLAAFEIQAGLVEAIAVLAASIAVWQLVLLYVLVRQIRPAAADVESAPDT